MDTHCVLCEVGTEFLNLTLVNCDLQWPEIVYDLNSCSVLPSLSNFTFSVLHVVYTSIKQFPLFNEQGTVCNI